MLKKLLIILIDAIRPLLGPQNTCRFTITCTNFAKHELTCKPLLPALWSSMIRVIRCIGSF